MSLSKESKELKRILSSNKGNGKLSIKTFDSKKPSLYYSGYPQMPSSEDKEDKSKGYCQWSTTNNVDYFPSGVSTLSLIPGLWVPSYDHVSGYFCKKVNIKTEGLLEFPETNSQRVINEIKTFWEKEDYYNLYGLPYKRGIILWGPPGSGKSCTIRLIISDVVKRGGVAFKFENPEIFIEVYRIFREIQPNTPAIVLMEDIDSLLQNHSETEILNILDGVEKVNKVVFLATTNYPEQLGERIINRPSRFDRRFKMPHPTTSSRKIYFEHLSTNLAEQDKFDISKWVKDTEGLSIAHLKSLFEAVCILGDSYKESLEILLSMTEDKLDSKDDYDNNSFGFKV